MTFLDFCDHLIKKMCSSFKLSHKKKNEKKHKEIIKRDWDEFQECIDKKDWAQLEQKIDNRKYVSRYALSMFVWSCDYDRDHPAMDTELAEKLFEKIFVKSYLDNTSDKKLLEDILQILSVCNMPKACKRLIEFGVNPNCLSGWHFTPLILSVRSGSEDVCRYLLTVPDIDLEVRGHDGGETALQEAIARKNWTLSRMLLEKGANPNTTNTLGFTPLMKAVQHGNFEICKLLLQKGANPNSQTGSNFLDKFSHTTALVLACQSEKPQASKICELLISHAGIDLNKQDKGGNTAIMYAAQNFGLKDVFIKLLSAGVRTDIRNNQNQDLYDILKTNKDKSADACYLYDSYIQFMDKYREKSLSETLSQENISPSKIASQTPQNTISQENRVMSRD